MDGRAWGDEGGAHGHEEAVEDEDAALELGAVKAAAEFLHVCKENTTSL